jgi:hypothetical protein
MPRSNGYRPKAAVKEEVMEWREKLSETKDWRKAQSIMNILTCLMGHNGGPSRGMICPRACSYCGYYGHTKQWCKRRLAAVQRRYDRECDALLAEDAKLGPTVPKDERALRFDAIEERMWEGVRRELGPKEPSEHALHCDCAECREWDEWMAPVRYAGEPKPQFYRLSDPGSTPMGARLLQCDEFTEGVPEERARWLVELWERVQLEAVDPPETP